ncbi:MAG: hypothetical protein J2P35_21360 [Actinobacteria bacterium]|nr:hypothetical protein [Actinomycetota bacterium]
MPIPCPATVISCARTAPGLGRHGFASTSFSVSVTARARIQWWALRQSQDGGASQ